MPAGVSRLPSDILITAAGTFQRLSPNYTMNSHRFLLELVLDWGTIRQPLKHHRSTGFVLKIRGTPLPSHGYASFPG